MSRPVVVVDVETSALRPNTELDTNLLGRAVGVWGVIVEAAWWNLATGEHSSFVPSHDVQEVRAHGELDALTVSRYLERLARAEQDKGGESSRLYEQLDGATLAGSNPAFDALFLEAKFRGTPKRHTRPAPWHHRLLDVSAYAAGLWKLPGDELPGLAKVCERLSIEAPDHTAAGDVRACGEALYALGAVERPGGGS